MAKMHSTIVLSCFLAVIMLMSTGCIDKQKLRVMFGGEEEYAPTPALVSLNANTGFASESESAQTTVTLDIHGSVSVLPLMKLLGEAFRETSGYDVNIMAGGKDAAVEAVENGEAAAALYSESGVLEAKNVRVIATDGVKLIANPRLRADDIEYDSVVDLFTDQDNMIGDEEVEIVICGPASRSRQVFEEIFPIQGEHEGMLVSLVPEMMAVSSSDKDVVDAVLSNPSAIGVVSVGADVRGAKPLRIGSLLPGDEGYCAIQRVVLYMKSPRSEAEKAFAGFIESDAAKRILSDNGFVTVK